MTDHKFTDEEVIKALECCITSDTVSACMSKCPLYEADYCPCIDEANALFEYALDLINRQREEIEVIKETTAEIRYESVKEFANSIKTYYDHIDKTVGALINYTIDQKLKEFLGEGVVDDA